MGRPMPSQLFGYEVLDFVGEGAGSVIYVVAHSESRQVYALKHVVRRKDKDERFFQQLQTEYEVGRRFSHTALRRSIDYKDNRTLLRKPTEAALVMELFDGVPLDASRPNTLSQIADCFLQVAGGLSALHSMGYVHCDLKPANILRGADGQVKIIDFGQASPIDSIKQRVQGTPDFIAPEQVKCQPVTPRTDIFNFGATMYWTLTGRPIPTLYTIARSENSFLIDEQIASPRQINPTVPEPMSNLVMDCVRSNPMRRPGDMKELISRLEVIQHVIGRCEMAVA